MKVYELQPDNPLFPIAWTDGQESGEIGADEIGTHFIGDEEVFGKQFDGPFKVKRDLNVYDHALVLIRPDRLEVIDLSPNKPDPSQAPEPPGDELSVEERLARLEDAAGIAQEEQNGTPSEDDH